MLAAGQARWQAIINAEVEKRAKKTGSTTNSTGSKPIGRKRVIKPPKFTSVAEHDAWFARNNLKGF